MGGAVLPVLVVPRTLQVVHVLTADQRLRRPHMPVQAPGVVDAEAHARLGHRARDLADEIPLRAPAHGVAVPGAGGVPQGHPVVVLGGGHDVVGARAAEKVGPGGGVEVGGVPLVQEVVVGRVAVDLPVVLGRRGALDADRVEVPLGVGVVGEPAGVVGDRAELCGGLGPGGHGVRAPVDEDAERGVAEPVGQSLRKGIPLLGVTHGRCLSFLVSGAGESVGRRVSAAWVVGLIEQGTGTEGAGGWGRSAAAEASHRHPLPQLLLEQDHDEQAREDDECHRGHERPPVRAALAREHLQADRHRRHRGVVDHDERPEKAPP